MSRRTQRPPATPPPRDERGEGSPGSPGWHPGDDVLQLAAEGLLDGARQRAMDEHIASCPRCTAEVASYRSLMGQLNAVPVAVAPAALAEAVLAAYERTTEPVAALWSDRKLLIAAALTNVLLVGAVIATVGVSGPVDLLSDWAITFKNLLLTVLDLLPAVEAIWTAMAHGGILVVAALALALMGTVAALRRTLDIAEESP